MSLGGPGQLLGWVRNVPFGKCVPLASVLNHLWEGCPQKPPTPCTQPAQSLTWEPPSSTSLLTSPFCPQGGLSQGPISAATVDHVPSMSPQPPPSAWSTTPGRPPSWKLILEREH